MGLPGAGKTTLAREVVRELGAVWFNADLVRSHLHSDLGFSLSDRIEHARRMGLLCDRVINDGSVAVADFVCPTHETRAAFGDAFVVWVDRIQGGRFVDTNKLFEPPALYHVRIPLGLSVIDSSALVCAQWRIA
ncbi:adenylyl-sulfate kinase [Methylosinus sp. R-45379]|uniref:adenylyl-sulfate kinase n=1 Tax=Methylosinus sp. R-45379 TaxID=980563 RepID=UPI0009FBD00A